MALQSLQSKVKAFDFPPPPPLPHLEVAFVCRLSGIFMVLLPLVIWRGEAMGAIAGFDFSTGTFGAACLFLKVCL